MSRFIKLLTGKPGGPEKEDQSMFTELTIDVLARTLWGEGRGEGTTGMEAIASVVLNRVAIAQEKGRYWWGNDIITVCQKPYQFSCWNRSDPNYRQLQAVTDKDIHFATALRIARRAVSGTLADVTNGATHYHTKAVKPFWAKGKTPTTMIGNHIFFRIIE